MSNFADYTKLQEVYGSIFGRVPSRQIEEIRPAYELLQSTLDNEVRTATERSVPPPLNTPLVDALQSVNSHLLPALEDAKMYSELIEIKQVCNSIVGKLPR